MIPADLEPVLDRYHHEAFEAFITGDPEPQKQLFSHADDVTIANPLGPIVTGWDAVSDVMDRASGVSRDGVALPVQHVSHHVSTDLVCIVEIERFTAKVGTATAAGEVSLRVTTVFRRESGDWKIVHRHADAITSPKPAESILDP
jgi:ketosteroid isomerase-like protein